MLQARLLRSGLSGLRLLGRRGLLRGRLRGLLLRMRLLLSDRLSGLLLARLLCRDLLRTRLRSRLLRARSLSRGLLLPVRLSGWLLSGSLCGRLLRIRLLLGRLSWLLVEVRLLRTDLGGLLWLDWLLRRARFLLRRGGPGELSGRGNERSLGLSSRLTGLFRDGLPLSWQLRLSRLVGRRQRELGGSRFRLGVGRRGFRGGNLRLIDLGNRRFCRRLRLRPGLLGR